MLLIAIAGRLKELLRFLIDNFTQELKEAFRFCNDLKIPQIVPNEYEGKIIWAEMTKEPCFVYDTNGYYVNQTCYIIPNANPYLCGILNSKIIYFYMKNIASNLGDGAFRWIKQYVENLPIPIITKANVKLAKEIVEIVKEILESKRDTSHSLSMTGKNPLSMTEKRRHVEPTTRHVERSETSKSEISKNLESKLDSLIYKLYNLNDEEIKIIESSIVKR